MGLYEHIAADYDAVTGESARVGPARRFLGALARLRPLRRALDAACGTGLHAVILAEMGAAVTGADISEAMLDRAADRARAAGATVEWLCAPMQELARHVAGPFDAVLCLGNSLPHLLTDADLDAALAGFAALLAPDGLAVLQVLNYARILARGERIVGVTRSGGRQFIRFYDFPPPSKLGCVPSFGPGELIQFNVLTLDWRDGGCETDLVSTPLRPSRPGELDAACRRAGLARIERFGGLDFRPFDEAESDVLVIVAGR